MPQVFVGSIVRALAHALATGETTIAVYPKHYRLSQGQTMGKRVEIVEII